MNLIPVRLEAKRNIEGWGERAVQENQPLSSSCQDKYNTRKNMTDVTGEKVQVTPGSEDMGRKYGWVLMRHQEWLDK